MAADNALLVRLHRRESHGVITLRALKIVD
jgi:hypothetical protein